MTAPIVVFDLDGTLVDSASDLLDSLNYALKIKGFNTFNPEDVKRLVGMGGRVMIERALTLQNIQPDEKTIQTILDIFLENYEKEMPRKTKFFNGVIESLKALHNNGFILAVCTNKYENLAKHLLNQLHATSYFSYICGGDTFAWRKPDGRAILSTIEFAGGDPERAVMVGDSRADIEAALNVDIPVIAVTFGYTDKPVSAFKPTKIINHFEELTPELINRLISNENK